ncbi:GDP-mannose 4,6-dehydratase [Telmatospirillum sp.]|uniref:GDP-mannose 4,6-dehydratase n=1 Tax=Telmatospirillum sp. TaxID=2079197 RepID=UPI00284864B0|nr:GDP-mannose 4,6-dehydratase [Telmatospirillum sp.]MDR3435680.1 GDP-mannose 4,6-dehydratase [Telmatospirillum sp.]
MDSPRTALIFGISGQDGAYLAHLLVAKGYQVHGTSRDAEVNHFANLERLGLKGKVTVHSAALNDFRSVLSVLRKVSPDEIYNLAGQSSVALSFEQPVETFESISVGSLNILDCLRFDGRPVRFLNAVSTECFGFTPTPADESTPFTPVSPYATAKAAAYWTTSNYRDAYGLFTCSAILGNHESPLRPVRFVCRKIVSAALRIKDGSSERLKLGNVAIERDWGWAPEYVMALWLMLQQDKPEDFVIATGATHSLQDFVATVFDRLGLDWTAHVDTDPAMFRPLESPRTLLNPAKAAAKLGWRAGYRMPEVAQLLIAADRQGCFGPTPWDA